MQLQENGAGLMRQITVLYILLIALLLFASRAAKGSTGWYCGARHRPGHTWSRHVPQRLTCDNEERRNNIVDG